MDSPWLIENLRLILAALGGIGAVSIFLRKSWNQSVRLYQDDLIQCRSREDGLREAVAQRDEAIAFLQQRSEYREDRMAELVAEVGSLRSAAERAIATTRAATEPPKS